MSQAVLKTERLTKVIGRRMIVSDISLELEPGEIFGFLGPNGAGKSTTIKMIVGLLSITKGEIYVDGHSVRRDFKKAMRDIGCIVENPDMYRYMSGLDNLRMFARMYLGVDEARIREVTRIVGLEHAIKDKVKTYSLGMKQRLGIAQALLHRPKLLILDEPTNGLDPAGIREVRELLRRLAVQEGLTVFVSSHILGEMQMMCDRVGIINKGKLITVKTVEELVTMTQSDGKVAVVAKTNDNGAAASLLEKSGIQVKLMADGVHIETQRDAVPQIVTALTSNGIAIYGLDTRETQTLEDVFMKLTGEDK